MLKLNQQFQLPDGRKLGYDARGAPDGKPIFYLWHGEEDKNIPVAMARYAATAIPKCEAKFYPDEGHLSLFKKHGAEIIRALAN
jgi:pimeloyl-ACP methyl ester carboxylesterase